MSSPFLSLISLIKSALGSMFFGGLVTGILYGILCVQSYTYFMNNHKDGKLLKTVVSLLWILDTLHLALIVHCLYFLTIENFPNIPGNILVWSALAQIYVTITSEIIVRWIFARRVWFLSQKSKVLIACIALLSILAFAFAFAFTTYMYTGQWLQILTKISYLAYASVGCSVAADTLIATFLCLNLWQRRTAFRRSDSLVKMLIMYTINTALLTSFCYIACLICFVVWPSNFVFLGIYFPIGNLFINSLLASLNNREALSEKLNAFPHSSIAGRNMTTKPSNSKAESDLPVINIELEESGSSLEHDSRLEDEDKARPTTSSRTQMASAVVSIV